jgi:hypothetical protein
MDKQDINWTQATVPEKILSIGNTKPNYNIIFHNNGQEIGKLDFNGPAMVFTGDVEESAKVFVDWIAQSFAGRLEEERKTEREACAKVCEDIYMRGYGNCGDAYDAIRERSSSLCDSANAGARGNT